MSRKPYVKNTYIFLANLFCVRYLIELEDFCFMAHYKIIFEPDRDMTLVRDVFEAILCCGKCDSSRVSVSCFFSELQLIDRIFSETGIDRIESATWEETDSLTEFLSKDYFSSITAFNIKTDNTSIYSDGQLTIPVLVNWDGVFSNETSLQITRIRKENSTAEEQRIRAELTGVYQKVFHDLSSLHFSSNYGGTNEESGFLHLPPCEMFRTLPGLLMSLNPSHISAGCRVGIHRNNKELLTLAFIENFHRKPQDMYVPGFIRAGMYYGTPFAINPDSIFYPVRNCGLDEAFRLAGYVRENISRFRDFTIFLPDIPWYYDGGITTGDRMNKVQIRLSPKKIEIEVGYVHWSDDDPKPKAVRDNLNKALSPFGITLK